MLGCEHHRKFWHALGLTELEPGHSQRLNIGALSAAWAQMPITPEDLGVADPPHPDAPASQDA
jgi:hypothetical protein